MYKVFSKGPPPPFEFSVDDYNQIYMAFLENMNGTFQLISSSSEYSSALPFLV